MKLDSKTKWIEAGYEHFALSGPSNLKVEILSKRVGINKSSFYHYFSCHEVFIDLLLEYHISQVELIIQKQLNCSMVEELIDVLIFHKYDILFNRQLRINMNEGRFKVIAEKSSAHLRGKLQANWLRLLSMNELNTKEDSILNLLIGSFYLQASEQNLNKEWLENFFSQIKSSIST